MNHCCYNNCRNDRCGAHGYFCCGCEVAVAGEYWCVPTNAEVIAELEERIMAGRDKREPEGDKK